MSKDNPEMTAQDVIEIIRLLGQDHIDVCIDGGWSVEYPYDSLNGMGTVNGYPVKCISPGWLVKFHTGYRLDENDYHDVKALCQRFGITMPSEYDKFDK
jgi:hypothetical protein